MRLDKFLSNKAYGSRREVHDLIKKGMISINEQVCYQKDYQIDLDKDVIMVNGTIVSKQLVYYIKFHKPCGYVTAVEDLREKTVMDLLPDELKKMGVFPVGRLDKDTSGLLLLTNDGQWGHRIINGTKQIDKYYHAEIEGELLSDAKEKALQGLILKDGTVCKPAILNFFSKHHIEMIVQEGKYHQVRRMIAALGGHVKKLKRVKIASLDLAGIENEGDFLHLEKSDINKF